MTRIRRLGAEPGIPVEHRRAVRSELERIGKIGAPHHGPVAIDLLLELPVADPDFGLIGGESGPAKTNAGRTFVVTQTPVRRIGNCGMGKDQLARRKGAGIAFADAGANTEKGGLKTQRAAIRQIQPTGGVPPFGAEIRVRAVIGRETQRSTRQHRGKRHGRLSRHLESAQTRQRDQKVATLHHQSSRTASTAS